jgi:hypothetical protein
MKRIHPKVNRMFAQAQKREPCEGPRPGPRRAPDFIRDVKYWTAWASGGDLLIRHRRIVL